MDDFNVSSLHESKNEWGARLLTILTPLVIEGLKSIFDESVKLCKDNNEMDKYLMTFQNLITRIPKWNPNVIENERKRIIEKTGCGYLEELVTCVHIIQLKLLTAIRVGQKQKKIDINIPKLDDFIHKAYINVARKIYKNVYLFEINIPPLQIQKHYREMEIIVQECILNTIRESIPVETILKAYMDETMEEEVIEEIKEETIEPEKVNEVENIVHSKKEEELGSTNLEIQKEQTLRFNDIDSLLNNNGDKETMMAPKTIERLEEISNLRNIRNLEDDETNDSNIKLSIGEETSDLRSFNIQNIQKENDNDFLLDDIEILT